MLPWGRSLRHIVGSFATRSIDVHEWPRATIVGPRLPARAAWSDVIDARAQLALRGWALAHAVVKADHVVAGDFGLASAGFLLQMDRILDFGSSGNLRLARGASRSMSDVTHSSVTGRVGQGLAILFAHQRGYRFVCHLSQMPEARAWLLANPAARPRRVADFLLEDRGSNRMILESKATISLAENDPVAVKGTLKAALEEQVLPWMTRLARAPTKGFAVLSALREPTLAPSMIAFVDPDGDDPSAVADGGDGLVRRLNYSSWLAAMGLARAARRLREGGPPDGDERENVEMTVVEVGGRRFAVRLAMDPPFEAAGARPPPLEILRAYHFLGIDKPWAFVAIGMDLKVARAVEGAMDGSDQPLLDLAFPPLDDVDGDADFSVFPDGTFLGVLPYEDLGETEWFRL